MGSTAPFGSLPNAPRLPSFESSARRKNGNADKSACRLAAKSINSANRVGTHIACLSFSIRPHLPFRRMADPEELMRAASHHPGAYGGEKAKYFWLPEAEKPGGFPLMKTPIFVTPVG